MDYKSPTERTVSFPTKMQFLLNELQFNSYMLYYGDLLSDEQKAEIIRRQIEIIQHISQLQQQGVEVFEEDSEEEEDIVDEDPPPEEDDTIYIG